MNRGVIIAAPASGAGKTTITLSLLRLLAREGLSVRGAKSGPDYIDPRFHEAACGQPCLNLDAWAMSSARLSALAAGDGFLIVEGAMGLFDGAPPDSKGAVADLAQLFELPVVLVVDAGRMAGSVAPLVSGFATHDPKVRVAAVILNNVGSDRHEAILRQALKPIGLPVLAVLHRDRSLEHPSRHLGLVQAEERPDLDDFLDHAADRIATTLDRDLLMQLSGPLPKPSDHPRLMPPAQAIAIAEDAAFAFAYPHILQDWRAQGAEIRFFSPLADDPVPEAGFVFLPGGYPELYADQISAAERFLKSLGKAAQSADIYGECGGYMVLGDSLTDEHGQCHKMAGLLRLETSFADRKLHLGYRSLTPLGGVFKGPLIGHEFHYATTKAASGQALFAARDAEDRDLPNMGLRLGRVSGSFAHVIDAA